MELTTSSVLTNLDRKTNIDINSSEKQVSEIEDPQWDTSWSAFFDEANLDQTNLQAGLQQYRIRSGQRRFRSGQDKGDSDWEQALHDFLFLPDGLPLFSCNYVQKIGGISTI